MITLFEENERSFSSLGLGAIPDAISCRVKEGLNDDFVLTLEYPVTGRNYNKITINRIIYCKTNPLDNSYQPFRISSIEKPINGIVAVEAVHVSYDMNGFPVKPISSKNLTDLINKIQNGEDLEDGTHATYLLSRDNPFTFKTNIYMARTFKTTAPYNLRSLLLGGSESVAEVYKAELQFNKFEISLLEKRGHDRGAKVIYGKNMTDIRNVSDNTRLYNGVYPYYHSEKTSNDTLTSGEFKQAYIVSTKLFQDGWLSYTENGDPFHPITDSPVQIATEGDYYQKVYCWNDEYQRFEEKIYNEQVMLIQDIIEPSWVSIDWSKFPKVICRARKKGYYKKSTDEDWGPLRGIGDIVFEESILSSGIMENIMLNFAEVIPNNTDSENTEVEEVVHVELDEPIIWINTIETRQMKHDNILSLDLTSEFKDEPTKEQLKNKAEEYISKSKIGISKDNIEVSFIDLTKTTEGNKYEKFEYIELGDTVHVIYEGLGVNTELRVISTEYDALLDRYEKIELGDKQEEISSESVQTGDNISSLTNDVGYADITTVNKLIANTVTAEWIEAVNAKMSKATINQLETERINCKGIIEASQFTIDTLVAKMLVAENAQISQTLDAGNIRVSGNINVKSGSITITGQEEGSEIETYFKVDRIGNVTANSVSITGGELDIGDGNFMVTNAGEMFANMATIKGTIEATSGLIGGFTIENDKLIANPYLGGYVIISPDSIQLGDIDEPNFLVMNDGTLMAKDAEFTNVTIIGGEMNFNNKFKVDDKGTVAITSGAIKLGETSSEDPEEEPEYNFEVNNNGEIKIEKGNINLGYQEATETEEAHYNFSVNNAGDLYAYNAYLEGTVYAKEGEIGGFTIGDTSIHNGTIGSSNSVYVSVGTTESATIGGSDNISGWAFTAGANFGVTNNGDLYAKSGKIAKCSISDKRLTMKTDEDPDYLILGEGAYSQDNPVYTIYSSGIITKNFRSLISIKNIIDPITQRLTRLGYYTEINENDLCFYKNNNILTQGNTYHKRSTFDIEQLYKLPIVVGNTIEPGDTCFKIAAINVTSVGTANYKTVNVNQSTYNNISRILCAVCSNVGDDSNGIIMKYDSSTISVKRVQSTTLDAKTTNVDIIVIGY